jgi:dihydrofolate reductase
MLMRKLRYNVAMSLDGYIAGHHGEYDWITPDESIDFDALFAQFDLFVMGKKTFLAMQAQGQGNPLAGLPHLVASSSLQAADYPGVEVLASGVVEEIARRKALPGKDIWLFGGGELFRHLLDAGLVDQVEVALMPTLLGGGIPLLPQGGRHHLRLLACKPLASGIVMLEYAVDPVG